MFSGNIEVAKGFQTSVNIAYDLNNSAKVKDFIPTQSGLDVIEDVLLSTADKSVQRARILIGAYGRGKSHIILVLMSLLLQKDKSLFKSLLAKMKERNPELYNYASEYLNSDKRILPIIIRGSSTSLSSSFLNALQITLAESDMSDIMPETHFQAALNAIENWRLNFPDTYKKFTKSIGKSIKQYTLELKEYSVSAYEKFTEIYPQLTSGSTFNPFLGFDVVELYESVTEKLKAKGYSGIYVVYDEFSKYLESSIGNATISDIKLLQDFAEKCARSSKNQMHLMLICHKDIANYIDGGLPKDKVDGWRGVSGRFIHMNLHNNYVQMYEIISAVIKKDNKFWRNFTKKNQKRFEQLSSRFTLNRLLDANNDIEIHNAIWGCYPLHPVSTFILPRLSEKIAQNERTLFTFLSAEERFTLSSFLSGEDSDFPLLTPDYIYDYFEPLLRKEPYTSDTHKLYSLTASVIQKVNPDSLEAKIIKSIALIYLVEQFEKLPPTADIISDIFIDSVSDAKEITDALEHLINKDYIVYQKRSNNYLSIKQSSGKDIQAEIESYIEKNRFVLNTAEILNSSTFESFLYPTRYNDKFEITRYFDFTFISAETFLEADFNSLLAKDKSDGIVYAVIAENGKELRKINSHLSKAVGLSNRLVFVIPNEISKITDYAYEYKAAVSLKSTVSSDEQILIDEFDLRIDDLSEVINSFINRYLRPDNGKSIYYHNGKKININRKAQLSELLSNICEEVYHLTPIINNETINRNTLTSQTINSRTRLLQGMLDTELKPNLGLLGNGQEVSIMRSTLVQTGILCDYDTKPYYCLTPKNKAMTKMLKVICDFFTKTATQGEVDFDTLYNKLIAPENGIGLKRGVIPIYIAVALHFYKNNLIIKWRDTEERITPDLFNGINEKPEDYSAIIEDWNEDKADYISKLKNLFKNEISEREKILGGFAYITSAMNRWYMSLPKYAKEMKVTYKGEGDTSKISDSRNKFINSLKTINNNPRDYLFERLIKMFGKEIEYSDIVLLVKQTKSERDNAVKHLNKALVTDVKNTFAKGKANGTLTSVIKDWCESLNDKTRERLFTNNENQILNLLINCGNDESQLIQRLAKAVTGLRLEDWSDNTPADFLNNLTVFKDTIDEFNNNSVKETENAEYSIVFKDQNGEIVTRVFEKTEYSKKAKILLDEVKRVIEEYHQAISENEKRQILMEVLEKYC